MYMYIDAIILSCFNTHMEVICTCTHIWLSMYMYVYIIYMQIRHSLKKAGLFDRLSDLRSSLQAEIGTYMIVHTCML